MSVTSTPVVLHHKAISEDLSYVRMEEELTCPVCLELYADPLMLPCSHSVCKKCLEDIMVSRSKASKEGLECPSCRELHKLSNNKVAKLPRNLALENIVFRFQEIQSINMTKSKSLDLSINSNVNLDLSLTSESDLPVFSEETLEDCVCGMCEVSKSKAVWFCQQCSVLYCEKCFETYHPKRGSLAHHRIRRPVKVETDSEPSAVYCKDHLPMATSIFCDQCKVLVCHLCVCEGTGNHSGHKILDLEKSWMQVKADLTGYKEKLESMMTISAERSNKVEEMVDQLRAVHSSAREKLEVQYDRIIKDLTLTLANHKRSALDQLNAILKEKLSSCSELTEKTNRQSEKMEGLAQHCKKLLDEAHDRQLLQHAAEVPPIAQQLNELDKRQEAQTSSHTQMITDRESIRKLHSSVLEFQSSAFDVLRKVLADRMDRYTIITPTVRSVMVTSPGKTDSPAGQALTPRAQNRTLISWGFNSTTFTAEQLNQAAQWSMVLEKNTSKIGDVKSGYLFGVGIAGEALSSKEQVGMSPSSAGIICTNGTLAFCQGGKMDSLVTLDQFPISVTLAASQADETGVIFTYVLTLPGWNHCLSGKVILGDPGFRGKIHPVFTVSQRVKLQFPICSNV